MAITGTVVLRRRYEGDGSTTSFAAFYVMDDDDLEVKHIDSSGTITTWTKGTEYTISGTTPGAVTVVVSTSPTDYTPAEDEYLNIYYSIDFNQTTVVPKGGVLDATGLENGLDYLLTMLRQVLDISGRSIHLNDADSAPTTITLPLTTDRVSKLLGFDVNGDVAVYASDDIHFPPLIVAVGDETTALTTGTSKMTFRMPFAMTLSDIRAHVSTAPTGSNIIVDVNAGGTTIMSTNKITIEQNEKTSVSATTQPVLTTTALTDDQEITIDIDQKGSGTAGAGLKVTFIGTQA